MVHASLRRLSNWLLPPTCALCAREGSSTLDLCVACAGDLLKNSNACFQCGEQLAGDLRDAPRCGACLKRSPRYEATHCAFRYSYPIDHLVRALKYHGQIAQARVLGQLLANSLTNQFLCADRAQWPSVLIPVPLAAQRFAERGFNQAIEIGKQLECSLQISLRADVLERRRATPEQAGLDRVGRRKNVRNAFAMCAPLPGKHVAIIDDVITTGSTVNEIARVLRRAGAERIDVWAVARASR